MRKVLLGSGVVVLLAVPTAGMSATKSISVRDDVFSPKSITINKGDTVRWRWAGRKPHNVTGRGFKSRTQRSGSYSRRFRRAGSYSVRCTLHSGMTMRIRVR